MGIFEFIVALGTIFLISILWVVLMYPFNMVTGTFQNNMTKAVRFNQTVNVTRLNTQYTIAYDASYFSLFFIIIVILIWVFKVSQEQQKREAVLGY